MEKALVESSKKSKINVISIFKEILPNLEYYENDSLIQNVINTILPMIDDLDRQLANNAVVFMGFAIRNIKKTS